MGNDQPLCKANDLDEIIEAFNPELHDSFIGYTQKKSLYKYLAAAGISINKFHRTLKKMDFINDKWIRHNCLFVVKWGNMDNRFIEVISFYNQHRVQSKLMNFILVLLKIVSEYYGVRREFISALLMGSLFGIGKYFNNFHSTWVRGFVSNKLHNQNISEQARKLVAHRVCIFDKGSARSVIDVDDPKDLDPIQKLLLLEKAKLE